MEQEQTQSTHRIARISFGQDLIVIETDAGGTAPARTLIQIQAKQILLDGPEYFNTSLPFPNKAGRNAAFFMVEVVEGLETNGRLVLWFGKEGPACARADLGLFEDFNVLMHISAALNRAIDPTLRY